MTDTCNIAAALTRMAKLQPTAIALRYPKQKARKGLAPYVEITYAQLDELSDHTAAALAHAGITRGLRTALMVRPGRDLFLLIYALFKLGAVPVLIDPGINRRALKTCLDEAAPEAFIGIALAQAARMVLGWARRSVRCVINVGEGWFFGGLSLDALRNKTSSSAFVAAATRADELAAILFTSGSTGTPKGVQYQHRHFLAQVEMLRDGFDILPGLINMPTFPPFALFDPALGVTSVIPDMDPTRPATADPQKLIAAIDHFKVNMLFGSPALLDTLSRYGVAHAIKLHTVQRVISAGAPVAPAIVERMRRILPDDCRLYTPYGATECLPVSVIESREILDDTRINSERGAGTCVGRPAARNTVRIIGINDTAIPDWSDDLLAAPGEVGEITVIGPTTSEAYQARPFATALAKIASDAGIIHRMGDLGYFDENGRLWFCGRKSQRVITVQRSLYTEEVEPIFNAHPEVKRTALVGVGPWGSQIPVLCVELAPKVGFAARERIAAELLNTAAAYPHTRLIQQVLFHRGFPVDIRHNAKIAREQLSVWATRELHQTGGPQ